MPSYDLRTLWVANNAENTTKGSLTPVDPATGKPGKPIAVDDPYNMYFSPDGKAAIVVAEAMKRLDFRDPKMPRFIFENPLDIPIQCFKGPVDNAEPITVNKGEFFTLSQYKGLPIENYMDLEVMYKVIGTQDTPNGKMYVWEPRMTAESKKIVNARRKEEMSVLVARRTLGEGEVLTPPALTA